MTGNVIDIVIFALAAGATLGQLAQTRRRRTRRPERDHIAAYAHTGIRRIENYLRHHAKH